jgi:hypothetical protein
MNRRNIIACEPLYFGPQLLSIKNDFLSKLFTCIMIRMWQECYLHIIFTRHVKRVIEKPFELAKKKEVENTIYDVNYLVACMVVLYISVV